DKKTPLHKPDKLLGGSHRSYGFTTLDIQGEKREINFKVSRLDSENGSKGYVIVLNDMTALNKLTETQSQLSAAMEQTIVSILITDIEGNIRYVNPAFEQSSGYTKEEVTGKNPRFLKSGEHPAKFYKDLWKTIRAGHVWEGVFVNKRKDGTLYYDSASISPIFNDRGEITSYVSVKQDITDQKLAEDKLKISEKKTSAILRSVGEGVIVIGTDSRILFVNHELEIIFGYKGKELIGKDVTELMPEKYRDDHLAGMRRNLAKGRATILGKRLEVDGLKKTGEIFPIELRVDETEIELTGERVFSAAIRDITSRKKAEAALRTKTNIVKLLQEISVATNEATTMDEAMYTCLEKICRYTGWEVGHVYMPNEKDILLPTDLWFLKNGKRFGALVKVTMNVTIKPGEGLPGRVYKTGKPAWISDLKKDSNFSRYHKAKDIGVTSGFAFPVLERQKVVAVLEFFSVARANPDESLLNAVGILSTQLGRVTERKRAGEAIKESEEKYRRLFELASDSIIIMDPVTRRIMDANTIAAKRLGYSMKEFLKLKIDDINPPDFDPDTDQPLNELLKGGSVLYERNHKHKDGSLIPVEVSAKLFNYGGRKVIQGFVRDITERKKAEDTLRETAEDLKNVGAFKDKMISVISHDLRSPLTSNIGLLDLSLRSESHPLTPWQRKIITTLRSSAMHQLKLVENLVELSKLHRGAMVVKPKRVRVCDILTESATIIKQIVAEKDIRLVLKPCKDSFVNVDHDKMVQVLNNLLTNAVKFTNRGGVVTLSCKTVGGKRALSVKDTGIGIAPERIEKLFDMTCKTSTFGTDGETGTGLGLSICQEITELNGGKITLKSKLGEGTEALLIFDASP
ncbi:diguanylate cyclase/phosphodiesterase (GGDEF & EAL domains) with PAS/PAC sensor(s), partial [hydrothermal vent metagenome]